MNTVSGQMWNWFYYNSSTLDEMRRHSSIKKSRRWVWVVINEQMELWVKNMRSAAMLPEQQLALATCGEESKILLFLSSYGYTQNKNPGGKAITFGSTPGEHLKKTTWPIGGGCVCATPPFKLRCPFWWCRQTQMTFLTWILEQKRNALQIC